MYEGSVVVPSFGGPVMVVTEIVGPIAQCRWLDGTSPRCATFPVSDLTAAPRERAIEALGSIAAEH
jgi:uncharacterized protein YodC (DUF2158 family)